MTVKTEILQLDNNETKLLLDANKALTTVIIEYGEISPDGAILRLKPLNRTVDTILIDLLGQAMAGWARKTLVDLARDNTMIAVVESSGNMLAYAVGKELSLPVVVIKKGKPATMFGEIVSEEIHSFTRKAPTVISVETKDITGKNLILVDDFAATGETLEAVEKMAQRAGGQIAAIAVAISKPAQGSQEVMGRIPSLSIVTIESMTPASGTEPARIKFAGRPEQTLVKKWGET